MEKLISFIWQMRKVQIRYQNAHNFITCSNMQLPHANEFLKLEFKYEMQIICELFKFLEIHNWSFIFQKNANNIPKCSGEKYLSISAIG